MELIGKNFGIFTFTAIFMTLTAVDANVCYPLPKIYKPGIKMCDRFVPDSDSEVFTFRKMENVRCYAYCMYNILRWFGEKNFVMKSIEKFTGKHVKDEELARAFLENSRNITSQMSDDESEEINCEKARTFYRLNKIAILPLWSSGYICVYDHRLLLSESIRIKKNHRINSASLLNSEVPPKNRKKTKINSIGSSVISSLI